MYEFFSFVHIYIFSLEMFVKVKYKKIRLCLKITSTHQIMFKKPIKNESNIGAPFSWLNLGVIYYQNLYIHK